MFANICLWLTAVTYTLCNVHDTYITRALRMYRDRCGYIENTTLLATLETLFMLEIIMSILTAQLSAVEKSNVVEKILFCTSTGTL